MIPPVNSSTVEKINVEYWAFALLTLSLSRCYVITKYKVVSKLFAA